MAVSNVELRVDARSAISALREASAASTQLDASIKKLTATLEQQQQQATQSANATRSAFNQLIGTLGGVAAAYGQLRIAQQAVQTGIQREESIRRLQFLAKGYNEVTQAQLAAARAGQQFGLSATESNQQFAQLYGRLRPLGVSLQDIEASFIGFNTAAKASGASTAESAGAFLQLSQALGSGVLRGEELNSVLENAPGLVVALTQELGKPVSEIRKLAQEGQITSDIVIRALKRAATEGADELAGAMQGPNQQVKNLQNAFQDFQVAVVENVLPATIEGIKALTAILQGATQYVKDFGAGWQIISATVSAALTPFQGIFNILGEIDGRLRAIGQNAGLRMLAGLIPGGALAPILNAPADIGRRVRQSAAGSGMFGKYIPGSQQIPFALTAGGGGAAGGGGGGKAGATSKAAREAERAAEAAAKEAQRVQEVIRSRLAEGQITRLNSELKDRIAAAEMAGDKQLVARLQGQQKELDIQYKYAQALAQEKDIKAQEAIIFEGLSAIVSNQRDTQRELNQLENESAKNQIAALQQQINLQYELTEQQKQQQELTTSIADTLGQSMTSAFDALIQGSEDFGSSLKKIASGVLIDIAQQLLQVFVVQKAINAISGLFGPKTGGLSYAGVTGSALGGSMISGFSPVPFTTAGLGFKAMGGSVTAGKPYIVGEKGPELFMPGKSGGIAPAGTFGGVGNIVVNVDASGSSAQGNTNQSKALGVAIGAAVQAEIIKQKKPGGLLY